MQCKYKLHDCLSQLKKKKDILQLLRLESYDSYTINAKRFIIYLKEKYIM